MALLTQTPIAPNLSPEVVPQCGFCQHHAEAQCSRCNCFVCVEHLRVINQDEICCLECAEKLMECLNHGHHWGEWHFAAENNPCTQVRECERCHDFELHAEHKWSPVRSMEEDVCVYFICTQCGKKQAIGHQFRVTGPRSEAYRCHVCGHVKRRKLVSI